MDDVRLVCARQRIGDLRRDVQCFHNWKAPRVEPLLERLTGVVRHDEKKLAGRRFVDLMNGADVGMVECRGRLRLVTETLVGVVVAGQGSRHELDRHRPIQTNVDSLVDHAHAAAAKLLDDLIMRNRAADHRRLLTGRECA